MNEAERAIVREGLREIESRLKLVRERTAGECAERVVIDGTEYAWHSRSLAVVGASAPTPEEDSVDKDLPENIRGENRTTKAVYRLIRRTRESRAGPSTVLKAKHLIAQIPKELGETRSDSAIHQAVRVLRKRGLIEKSRGYGWMLVKGIDHRPDRTPPPGTETAMETAKLQSG